MSVPENSESPATSGHGPIPRRQENVGGDTSAVVRAVERQTQAMIAAGEKLRAALEENGAATVSMMQRLLASVGDTNLKLGALDRRLAELEGRVRGALNR